MNTLQQNISVPNSHAVSQFERFFRVKLPLDFLTYLKENNGSKMEMSLKVGDRDILIERLLCLVNETEKNDSIMQYEIGVVIAQVEDRLTDDENLLGMNVIPFATVFGGDLLCLDLRNESQISPPILLWDHNASTELATSFIKVADSFRGLISAITYPE